MAQAALYAALACGFLSALAGGRTAWVLLASVAFCLVLEKTGFEFQRHYWFLIDVTAMMLIVGLAKRLTLWDRAVLALFPLAWGFYFLPDPYRYFGSVTVTCLQLLLTFPAANVWGRIKHINRRFDPWDHFNMRARHEGIQ